MRHILHADLDAFYASVEQRDDPTLRGKPVVVGGRPEDRGVVAAASYEARRFGVRSAMPMRTAIARCPHAIRVSPRFEIYGTVSRQVMEIFREFTETIEPLSLDEAFLDVTHAVGGDKAPAQIASALKRRVKEQVGLTISVGVATSKSVAKIASDMDKPDGLTVVPPGAEREFLAPLPVSRLPGVGPKTAARLEQEGIHTIGELASKPAEWFESRFGKTGTHLGRLARGTDDRSVQVERQRKSVSAETTLSEDTGSAEVLRELVNRLSQRVWRHLERRDERGRTVKLKLRLADFTTFTRQRTLDESIDSANSIVLAAQSLLEPELVPGRLFRLVGVGVSGLEHPEIEEPAVRQPRLLGLE